MRKLLVYLLLTFLSQQALATSEDSILAFAKRSAGKFSTEIDGLPMSVTVRTKPFDGWWKFAEYDQNKQILLADHGSDIHNEWLFQRCTNAGTFVGQNSFGAKAHVQKQRCERLEVQDVRIMGMKIGSLDCSFVNRLFLQKSEEELMQKCREINFRRFEISMTPQQYRAIKERGPIYEIDFDIGADTKQEVVSDNTVIADATVNEPIEKIIRVLRVHGKFKVVRIITPDGKNVLATYYSD